MTQSGCQTLSMTSRLEDGKSLMSLLAVYQYGQFLYKEGCGTEKMFAITIQKVPRGP